MDPKNYAGKIFLIGDFITLIGDKIFPYRGHHFLMREFCTLIGDMVSLSGTPYPYAGILYPYAEKLDLIQS